MNVLPAGKLLELARTKGSATTGMSFGPVDFGRPFVHEQFTPLYYTSPYCQLSHEQKLRYNQLSGMRLNEGLQIFEGNFITRFLGRLAVEPRVLPDPSLRDCLIQAIREEQHHDQMFRALNKWCWPEIYQKQDYYFAKLSWFQKTSLGLFATLPHHLTTIIWIVLYAEEWAANLSKAIIRTPQTESLGELEPNFIKAHRAHLADEARHVQMDVHLIRALIHNMPKWKRMIDVWLSRILGRATTAPKRSAIAVIRQLLKEYPSLTPMARTMVREIARLSANPRFVQAFCVRGAAPLTFLLFDELQEFRYLADGT